MRLRFKTMWAEGMTLPKFVEEARIAAHESPGAGVYIMTLMSPAIAAEALPGQFVDVSVLPRCRVRRDGFGSFTA